MDSNPRGMCFILYSKTFSKLFMFITNRKIMAIMHLVISI